MISPSEPDLRERAPGVCIPDYSVYKNSDYRGYFTKLNQSAGWHRLAETLEDSESSWRSQGGGRGKMPRSR